MLEEGKLGRHLQPVTAINYLETAEDEDCHIYESRNGLYGRHTFDVCKLII